ncbi:restriction endonuclease subunit S [Schwartzia succinivorans]|jgi:restriction endonuclease S subunit|uniref:Type I restriction enzyme, S subunit n=1 Tax=Schwartzia succinivorans DSM 10502 TaxID=1123243 RepID=A0A1M4VZR3_9FIRM|nr:restriction endonuclease subunit S [Schwartzia succinivorans]SHE74373.1 type I restriction enzyme, S subunit [Schwartzia succinivorans DSM 10502]
MDGHECSEVLLSEILRIKRMDAEYYSKEYVYETEQLLKRKHFNIGKYYKVTDGEHGSVDYLDCGVKYLTAENIRKGYIDLSKIRYVSEDVDKKNARARVQEGDILISIKGTLGQIAVATADLAPCNMNRDVAIIKPLYSTTNSNYFMALFMMGKYGALQSQRGGSGGVQQMITLGRLREFIIPEFSEIFYDKLKKAYEQFLKLMNHSKESFEEAEEYLLDKLEVKIDKLSTNSIAIKSLGESFSSVGRIDAEYYQQKNYDMIGQIRSIGTIGNLCNIYDKTFTPVAGERYQYIELANIGKVGDIDDVEEVKGEDLPARARRLVKKGYVIVSSVEGSLESCALVTEKYDNALCSTGFYVIDSDNYNSETLLVLLKSKPIQMLLKRGCSGTILTNITKDEFMKIPLPKITNETQDELKKIVRNAYDLRKKSRDLLNYSKRAVEMAIEENEVTATKWLEKRISTICRVGF